MDQAIPPGYFQPIFQRIGVKLLDVLHFAGGFGLLTWQILKEIFVLPFPFRLTVHQIYLLGIQSIVLVGVTGLATGSVMALQFGFGLAKFGGKLYVPKVVALTILREMGPVFTSLLVAGRIGSGIAAEVGSMKVSQQIDAMRALGTSPIKQIVIPRLVACMIGLPILTLFADYIAIVGAMLVSAYELQISVEYFFAKCLDTLIVLDVTTGLAKTIVFAFFIAITACWRGLNTEGGTQGVGASTTWVVVTSSIFIMISDYFLSKFFIIAVFPAY